MRELFKLQVAGFLFVPKTSDFLAACIEKYKVV